MIVSLLRVVQRSSVAHQAHISVDVMIVSAIVSLLRVVQRSSVAHQAHISIDVVAGSEVPKRYSEHFKANFATPVLMGIRKMRNSSGLNRSSRPASKCRRG